MSDYLEFRKGNSMLKNLMLTLLLFAVKKGSLMPAFADALSDKQIAAIAGYLRNAWNNRSGDSVSAKEVRQQR